MSAASDRVTPSTSADRVPEGSSNNHLLPPEAYPTPRSPPTEEKTPVLPLHRRTCITCGCPNWCCTRAGFLCWVMFLILIQGGPIAILYMDHHYSDKYGSTLSRWQTEEGMQSVLCRTVGIYSVNVTGTCDNVPLNIPCLRVRVIVYSSNSIKPLYNTTFLRRSEREYLLAPHSGCFNLDICKVDARDSWIEYRQQIRFSKSILDAKRKANQSFICHYKIKKDKFSYRDPPIVLLEKNTTFWDFSLWFILPITCLCCCWLCIVFLCYWFCYPCDKEEKDTKEYHEINTIDVDRSDYSINSQAGGSSTAAAYVGSGDGDGGGWPTKGPTDGDSSAWPLYWR